ncbi:MAG: sulfite exporter TauE/SafE family protein [Chloroflexi bacterium]|nr:sulfite exporter TauE/SafE family protein [Chloroflexota bacterium]
MWWAGLALLGLAVGLAAGMFGVGGGFLLTPMLNALFGVPMDVAVGTGLCQMIGTAVAAYRRHQRLKQGEVKIDWIMMAGALLGVQLGAGVVAALAGRSGILLLGRHVSALKFWLSLVYIVLLLSVGLWMLHDARVRRGEVALGQGLLTRLPLPPYAWLPMSHRRVSVLALSFIGLFLGFLSGLIGIGGGVVLMPILIYGIGMNIRTAAGTGILLLVATSISGTVTHARMGHVHLGLAMVLLAGSTIGAPIGATLTSRIEGYRLRGLFAGLVFLAAAAVIWSLLAG